MKKILYGLSALIFVLIAIVVALPFFLSAQNIQDQVTRMVKSATGRDLVIRGKTSLSVFPQIALDVKDVALSNPPGMASGAILRADSLRFRLELMPLLQKRVEIRELNLKRPVISLLVDRQGRMNWKFSKGSTQRAPATGTPARPAAATPDGTEKTSNTFLIALKDIRPGVINITDGAVYYQDMRSGTKQSVTKLTTSISVPDLSGPAESTGSLLWKGESIAFNLYTASIRDTLDKKPVSVRISLTSSKINTAFDGNVQFLKDLQVRGAFAVDTPSVRRLVAWLGGRLPSSGGFGALTLSTQLNWRPDKTSLTKLQIGLDDMKAEGGAQLRLSGKRPFIEATLAADKLDLNTYMRPAGKKTKKAAAMATKEAPSAGSGTGWSTAAFDLTGLDAVDADIRLSASQLFYQKIKVGNSALAVTLKDGVLKADLGDLRLYDGRATGRLTVYGGKRSPALSGALKTDSISILPFLTDAAGFNWVSGTGVMAVSLSGHGKNPSQIIKTLSGKGKITFRNGAIEGINIAQMIRGIKKGTLSGWNRKPSQSTDFSLLTSTFTIKNGIAGIEGINMVGPLVRLTANGKVDLPRKRLNIHAVPKLVASLKGQGGKADRKGLSIPVKIKGPWSKPKIIPDLKALLKDPGALVDKIRSLGKKSKKVRKVLKKIKKGDVENLIKGFLGGKRRKSEPAPEPAPATGGAGDDPVGNLLNDLLKNPQ